MVMVMMMVVVVVVVGGCRGRPGRDEVDGPRDEVLEKVALEALQARCGGGVA